jgi:hypothetical protein
MRILKITVEDIGPELHKDFERLNQEMKDKHGVDILSQDVGVILEMFEDVFRPICIDFQNKKITSEEFFNKLVEYGERVKVLESVAKYAMARYNVNFSEEPYVNVFFYNREKISKELTAMCHLGKSLEDGYRYILKQASHTQADKGTTSLN